MLPEPTYSSQGLLLVGARDAGFAASRYDTALGCSLLCRAAAAKAGLLYGVYIVVLTVLVNYTAEFWYFVWRWIEDNGFVDDIFSKESFGALAGFGCRLPLNFSIHLNNIIPQ